MILYVYGSDRRTFYPRGYPHINQTLRDLGLLAGVPARVVASLVADERGRYREYSIPKSSGGSRVISVPVPSLMAMQRVIKNEILEKKDIHVCAVGFRTGYSIKSHVERHVSARRFIKIDIKDCFGSVKFNSIVSKFRNLEFNPETAYCLSRLVSHKGSLPQGAPSSPILCNIVLEHLDNRIQGLCQRMGMTYTRYADDIVVSGEAVNIYIFQTLQRYVNECGFQTNDKTRLMIDPSKLIICGISISNGEMKVPREWKRTVRSQDHFLAKNGIIGESKRFDYLDPFYVDRVLGKLSFWQFVEADAAFPVRYGKIIRELYQSQFNG